jgi:hypothetical protein
MKTNTHQKFQTLLQFAADQPLAREEQRMLDRHLAECSECRKYAQGLHEIEYGLQRVMEQHWNVPNRPISVAAIKSRANQTTVQHRTVATFGKFAFIPMLALTLFMVMTARMINPQKASSGLYVTLSGTPSMVMIVPRPNASASNTLAKMQTCKQVTYMAQQNETLSGIAIKYGVSKEAIASMNGLSTDKFETAQMLLIPICPNTPVETPTAPNTLTLPSAGTAPRG